MAFLPVAVLLVVTPGADFAVVVRNAIHGRAQGMTTGAGTVVGMLVHTCLAAFGLSALLASSAAAFTIVKVLGAVYLCWLGARALWESRPRRPDAAPPPADAPSPAPAPAPLSRAFRDGVLTNVLNPKAPLVFMSILPQFMSESGPSLPQTLVLSAVLLACALPWYLAVAALVTRIRGVLERPAVRRLVDRVTGGVLLTLGVSLVFERRPLA